MGAAMVPPLQTYCILQAVSISDLSPSAKKTLFTQVWEHAVGHNSWWHWLESELHGLLSQNSKGSKPNSNSSVKGLHRTQIHLQLLYLAGKDLTTEQQEEHGVHLDYKRVITAGIGNVAWLCCRNAPTHADDAGSECQIRVNHKTPRQPGCKCRSPGCCLGKEEELPYPIKSEMTLTASLNDQRWFPTGWVWLRLLSHSSAVPLGEWTCISCFPQRNYAIKSCLSC